jgi:hypothetical protein
VANSALATNSSLVTKWSTLVASWLPEGLATKWSPANPDKTASWLPILQKCYFTLVTGQFALDLKEIQTIKWNKQSNTSLTPLPFNDRPGDATLPIAVLLTSW